MVIRSESCRQRWRPSRQRVELMQRQRCWRDSRRQVWLRQSERGLWGLVRMLTKVVSCHPIPFFSSQHPPPPFTNQPPHHSSFCLLLCPRLVPSLGFVESPPSHSPSTPSLLDTSLQPQSLGAHFSLCLQGLPIPLTWLCIFSGPVRPCIPLPSGRQTH